MPRTIYTPTLYLRFDKKKLSGEIPIYVRFQRIGGKEPKFPLGIDVTEDNWDEMTRRPKDPTLELIVGNRVMEIKRLILNAIGNGIEITHTLLKEFVEGKPKPEQRSFYDYFDEYVRKKCERGKIRDSTREGYDVTRKALKDYHSKINLSDINTKFLEGFEKFLINRGKSSGKGEVLGTRSNRLKHVNAVLNYIERQGVAVENPYKTGDLEIPKAAVNDVFLGFEELRKLIEFSEKLEVGTAEYKVLFMYLFSCATGLRIGDAVSLKWGDILKDSTHNKMVISKIAKKTRKPLNIVVPELGIYVLYNTKKYSLVIPDKNVFCCSKNTTNNILRDIVTKAGIDKYITYHSSRRTYASLAKAMNVSNFVLQNSMGHDSINTTKDYIKWDADLALELSKTTEIFKMDSLLNYGKKG